MEIREIRGNASLIYFPFLRNNHVSDRSFYFFFLFRYFHSVFCFPEKCKKLSVRFFSRSVIIRKAFSFSYVFKNSNFLFSEFVLCSCFFYCIKFICTIYLLMQNVILIFLIPTSSSKVQYHCIGFCTKLIIFVFVYKI